MQQDTIYHPSTCIVERYGIKVDMQQDTIYHPSTWVNGYLSDVFGHYNGIIRQKFQFLRNR